MSPAPSAPLVLDPGATVIIGLTGEAGAGKDSVAQALFGTGFRAIAFADALRAEVAEAWRVDVRMLIDRVLKETPLPALAIGMCNSPGFLRWAVHRGYGLHEPRSARWLMQHWGTEYRRGQDPGYWLRIVQAWLRRQLGLGNRRLIVTDVRFEIASGHGLARLGPADMHHRARIGLGLEVVIEADHAVHLGARQVQRLRHPPDRLRRHKTEAVHDAVQHLQQPARQMTAGGDRRVDRIGAHAAQSTDFLGPPGSGASAAAAPSTRPTAQPVIRSAPL